MPFDACPFTVIAGQPEPILPITIINPETGKSISTNAYIDTGAHECTFPSWIAISLGHELRSVAVESITTGGGDADTYPHTTTIEILHPKTKVKLYTVPNVLAKYMEDITVSVLGVKSFLSKVVLTIDYPNQCFSIKLPKAVKRSKNKIMTP